MPFGALRHDERRLAARAEMRVDRCGHDVEVGDAAVRGPRLRAVEDPLVLGFVVHGLRLQRRHIGAGVGLGHAVRADHDVVRSGAEALRHPLHHLLGRAVAGDAGGGEAGAEDREADAGVAPEQLLERDRQREPGVVAHRRLREEVERVQADLGGLLHDRHRELLPLVPLVGGRAHHGGGEIVHPVLDLLLVLVESEGELGHVALQGTKVTGR